MKRLLPPSAAEYYFERHVILTISRSEIVKMTYLSKYNLARSTKKILFTQPQRLFGAKRHNPFAKRLSLFFWIRNIGNRYRHTVPARWKVAVVYAQNYRIFPLGQLGNSKPGL